MWYGVCKDIRHDHWGEAPPGFDMNEHFLICGDCGKIMYLQATSPLEAGFTDKTRVKVYIKSIVEEEAVA